MGLGGVGGENNNLYYKTFGFSFSVCLFFFCFCFLLFLVAMFINFVCKFHMLF